MVQTLGHARPGLLDELIQMDVPAPAGQLGIITQRTKPATEQKIAALLAADMCPFPASELDWQEQALCAQADPEAFFPEKGSSTRAAKRLCLSCPVRSACLDYALATDERFGIWGGLTERERRRVKKGTLDPQTVPLPAPPRRAPVPSPAVAQDIAPQAASQAPTEPVPCLAPDCTQLVTVEFIRHTGLRIHPPCRARLASATTSNSHPEPGHTAHHAAGAGAPALAGGGR